MLNINNIKTPIGARPEVLFTATKQAWVGASVQLARAARRAWGAVGIAFDYFTEYSFAAPATTLIWRA